MMIALTELNMAADEDFVNRLRGIYEHSDWVPRRILKQRPFPNREDLQTALRVVVENSGDGEKLALIRAHPDLAGKLARAGVLTAESTREQAGLGLDRLSDDAYENFSKLNQAYQDRFGFPFIICARLTTQAGVLDSFAARLLHSKEIEIQTALVQIHEIARLRLEDLVGG
jgi:2-oxo-4-hydroxy-4-carboxy-5-ureidoimidazoline decarboxylase